ncbi:MAG: DUF3090 domain-containing protein [Candidatus Rokuibacteriota bacterium]|nr:MAG: DUF3090 domain-containing protein [Candidatus Rokubacteria bacterium]
MSASFNFDAPDHFTAGAVGPPGQRVFYLQSRQARQLVTLKSEKEQVRALAEYLAQLLQKLAAVSADDPGDTALLEPVTPAWVVAALGAGYDQDGDRVVVEVQELLEEEEASEEPAVARFRITRAQAAAFVERVRALMQASRPICPVCHQPKDPDGHVCPRSNGHVARPRA